MNPRRILCPIDFSENSRIALDRASEEASQFGAKLFVVHVESMRQSHGPGSAAYLKELDEHRHLLEEGKPYLEDVDYEQHYLRGDVVEELIRFAEARDIDRIILGTHGRTGLSLVFMGSVAAAVTKHSSCEVVTVPIPKQESSESAT